MKTCKVFVPFGAMGVGITKEAFESGISLGPDIIACDAGSTDSGPYYLGTGRGKYARESVKEDLRLMVVAGNRLGVPVAIGSCGTCGSNLGVDDVAAMVEEICQEENISVNLAKIYSQQNPEILKEKYRQGLISPLAAAPEISEKTFDECSNIVALAGAEPFIEAYKSGANVIICGRSTDTAILAFMPIMMGCDEASAWHAAKIAECGSLCTQNQKGGVFLIFDEEGVTMEPAALENKCTVYSTSAHMLYENSDPFVMVEPGVIVDVFQAVYTQVDDRRVRITGAKLQKADYTMKLEGAGPVGYQTISLVGVADRRVMSDPENWIKALEDFAQSRLKSVGVTGKYSYCIKPYGLNAVTGRKVEEGKDVPLEMGLLLVVTADSQELATKVAKVFNPILLHFPVKKNEQNPSFAFPFSPAEVEKGQIYEFKLNHVVSVKDPLELVKIEYVNI